MDGCGPQPHGAGSLPPRGDAAALAAPLAASSTGRVLALDPSTRLPACLHPGTEDSTRGVLRYVDAQYPGAALDAIAYVTVAGSAVTADKERTLTLTLTVTVTLTLTLTLALTLALP